MRTIISILAVAVMSTVASAQTKTAPPVTGNGQETAQQVKNTQDQQTPPCGWQKGALNNPGKYCEPMCGYGAMQGQFCRHGGFFNGCGPMGMTRMHGFAGAKMFHILFFGLIVMIIIRILLTIIVSIDMSRTGHFMGLWVAIVLLTGLSGTAVYALFRIGDTIERVKQKA